MTPGGTSHRLLTSPHSSFLLRKRRGLGQKISEGIDSKISLWEMRNGCQESTEYWLTSSPVLNYFSCVMSPTNCGDKDSGLTNLRYLHTYPVFRNLQQFIVWLIYVTVYLKRKRQPEGRLDIREPEEDQLTQDMNFIPKEIFHITKFSILL